MPQVKGAVALIGSGELSATMVETHKMLLALYESGERVLFLDTPAGFQENIDLIAARAAKYFESQVGREIEIASFKAAGKALPPEKEKLNRQLAEAKYVLIGPGSPTYAVRQLKESSVPALLNAMVARGGCLVAASAAALSVGSHTLPVYEIYKVGEALHWVEGLNIIGHLGCDLVVIPHWNNAEGGNHDTRFCYMGEKRFLALESMLPPETIILGLDEHTACIFDFSLREALVTGLGQVVVRHRGCEQHFARDARIPFALFENPSALPPGSCSPVSCATGDSATLFSAAAVEETIENGSFWSRLHDIEATFYAALAKKDLAALTLQLLEADRLLWQAQLDLENPEFVSQGRELYREMIVMAGTGIEQAVKDAPRKYEELVKALVMLREEYRQAERWPEADRIRSILLHAGAALEDTEKGPRWRL